jgi:hypothetical protein
MLLRIDLVFSYWIFAWYLLYIYRFPVVTNYSPKFAIGLGIVENIFTFLFMFYFGSSNNTLLMFVIINTFIKLLPFYTLRNETIQMNDIYASIILFFIYAVWVYINGESVIEYQNKILNSLAQNKHETPFMYFLKLLKKQNEISKLNI